MMSEGQQYDDAQSRLTISEVPGQISRLFFGESNPSYNAPSSSYGAPSSSYYAPSTGAASYYPPYPDYYSDIELLAKLGQAALIVFMILSIVAIIFMLVLACLYCAGGNRSNGQYSDPDGQPSGPAPYKQQVQPPIYDNEGFNRSSHINKKPPIAPQSTLRQSSYHSDIPPPGPMVRQPGWENLDHDKKSRSEKLRRKNVPQSSASSLSDHELGIKTRVTSPRPQYFYQDDYDHDPNSSLGHDTLDRKTKKDSSSSSSRDGKANKSSSTSSSDHTTETIISTTRPLPKTPKGSKRQSSSDRISLDRSVRYYDVPVPKSYPTRKATLISDGQPFDEADIPPPLLLDASSLSPRSRRPYSYIEKQDQKTIQSRLI